MGKAIEVHMNSLKESFADDSERSAKLLFVKEQLRLITPQPKLRRYSIFVSSELTFIGQFSGRGGN